MPHIDHLARTDSLGNAKLAVFTKWFEEAVVKRLKPIVGKQLVIGQQVKTDATLFSNSLPFDLVTTVKLWGFEADDETIEQLEKDLDKDVGLYFLDDAAPVNVTVKLIYLGKFREEDAADTDEMIEEELLIDG